MKSFRKILKVSLGVLAMLITLAFFTPVLQYGANQLFEASITPTQAVTFLLVVGIATALFKFSNRRARYSYAVTVEIWVDWILENLFKDDSFINHCHDESDSVLGGGVVHIPVAGAKPTVVKNRSSYPATAVQRADTDITYALDVFTTDPVHITDAEQMEISYDKMSNVLSEHTDALRESVSDELLYKWAPTVTTYILRTTGADAATNLSPSATGTRKKLLKEDLKRASALMNKNNVPKSDRCALIPSDLYQELIEDADLMKRDGIAGGEIDIRNGIIAKLYGFNIMERSTTTVYTNAAPPVPKAPTAAAAATDNQAVICWQKGCVTKARGTVRFFENIKDATFYGDIYSALLKMGGRRKRDVGVIAIVQTVGA